MKILSLSSWKLLPIWLVLFSTFIVASTKNNIISVIKVNEIRHKDSLSLCAKLTKYAYVSDANSNKPYIKITPHEQYKLSVDYDGICIDGLKPRRNYSITINKNIPLEEYKLDRDYTFTQTTTDYQPSLSFKDDGYILPSKGEISIPIESTNCKKLAISLYRINRNNLIQKINQYGLIRTLNSYSLEEIVQTDGYFLWQKKIKIASQPNITATTALPVGEHLKERKPGVYILTAQRVDSNGIVIDDYDVETQWFMVSDIGLYTLRDSEGLRVYTRRLSDALPYNGVKLELISKNNEVLDSILSKNGEAIFADSLLGGTKGLQPKAIYAYGADGDFSVIDLTRAAHDLSDRGVQGRDNPGKYDAFIYSNRGIFRPGESIPVHMLVRNQRSQAQAGVKLSLKLFDSTGVEIVKKALTTDVLGYCDTTIPISQSANRGKWHLKLYAGSQKPIGSLSFLVEDFVPPKIKIDLENSIKDLNLNRKDTIEASVKYLNNMPLVGATISGSTILHRAKEPFAQYRAYSFGDVTESFDNRQINSFDSKTDANGRVSLPIKLDKVPFSTLPLAAHITIVANEPGGRPVERVIDAFLEDKSGYIGIKPSFKNSAVDMNAKASFDIIHLQNRKLTTKELNYRVVAEDVHWTWSYRNSEWSYQKTYSDGAEILRGTLFTTDAQPVPLVLEKLDWGGYRLEVMGDNGAIATYRFTSGYEESISKSSPDRLPIAIDKQSYTIGEKVRVHITPKFSGPAMVSVANSSIIESKNIELKAGEATEIEFIVDKSLGSSSYILATAFRGQSKKLGANRAIGLAHIEVVNPEQTMDISLQYAKKVKSSQSTKVTIYAKKANSDEPFVGKARFTLAAVDDGVLRLTNYALPDPKAYYFGQQKLGIEIRDIYADLIKTMGAHAKFNVGAGDGLLEPPKYDDDISNKGKVIALMTQELSFDSEGRAEVELDIPDYQGSLKLMAVAWSENAVGSQSGDMVVKDMISPQLYTPKFISVGDKVESLLSVDFDVGVESGQYQINFISENATQRVKMSSYTFDFDGLKPAQFKTMVELQAPTLSDQKLIVEVTKGDELLVSKEWDLSVRAKYPQAYVQKMGLLNAGSTLDAKKLFDMDIWSDINTIGLKLSGDPILPTASLATQLIEYGGRCAEQTTSRAMPWLFLSESVAKEQSINRQAIIQTAIDRLLNYQKLDGGFGLWSGSSASVWVSSYVLDFLTRAKKLGYSVSDRNIKVGLDWLENSLNRWSTSASKQESDAYALYVLTRSGRTLMSEILYHAQNKNSKIKSAQAWAHLASSLAYVGEKKLAIELFEKAKRSLGSYLRTGYYSNYGGGLRDEAALVVLMIESKSGLDWSSSLAALAQSAKERRYYSTQEMSLLLRVAYLAQVKSAELKLSANGKVAPIVDGIYSTKIADMASAPSITNEGSGRAWYSSSYKATPIAGNFTTANNNGFSISKKIYDMSGNEVDLSRIEQNSRLVIVIEGQIESNHIKNPLVTDWAIAGFELENPNVNGVDATTTLKWLGKQTAAIHTEYRDDRYVVAFNPYSTKNGRFKLAYVVRAVMKGEYTLAPTRVEDMYQPYYRAFSMIYRPTLLITDKIERVEKKPKSSTQGSSKLSEDDYLSVNQKALGDMNRYTIVELNFLRNAIFAHAGLDFSQTNPMLHRLFAEFAWYHPNQKTTAEIYASLDRVQKENIAKLINEERRRGGGLVLADYYRVNNKLLTMDDLAKYSKDQLYLLRNSLFARRGVRFNNPRLAKIFSYMPWYQPTDITSSTIFDEIMSEREKANVRLIISMEKR